MELDVVIPTSHQYSGIGPNYFESAPLLNLLPLVHKTGIEYLVDDLLKLKSSINRVIIVASEDNKEKYESVLYRTGRNTEKLKVIGFPHSGFHGIFPVVQKGVKEIIQKEKSERPILVVYGDTLIQDRFWQGIVKFVGENLLKKSGEERHKKWILTTFMDWKRYLPSTKEKNFF